MELLKVMASFVAHNVQVGGHLLVTATQEGNMVPDPDTRSGRALRPWVPAQAHLIPVGELRDERRLGARDEGQTSAARGPAVAGLGDVGRPWSRRSGQGPRANFCASGACSGWVGGCTTTVVEARRPGTKGKLLRLGGQQ